MTNAIIEKAKERFAHSHESLAREFGSIRAGRANASLLDRITVEYYGAPTPLNQLASITVPEARVLLISPFDKGSIADIERAINESDLGINPANDGSVVRLVIPALTEETRKELAKEVKKVGENAKIAIRNIRRDAMDEAKKQEKDKEITEDQLKALEKDIQKATDDAVKFDELTHVEVIKRGLKIMDATASTLSMDNDIDLVVFNMNEPGNIKRVIFGEQIGTTVSNKAESHK